MIDDAGSVVDAARSTPGVLAATPAVLAGTQVSAGDRTGSWSVQAVDPASYAEVFTIPDALVAGRFLDPDATDEIVLGLGVAGAGVTDEPTYRASLRSVAVGDSVQVTMVGGAVASFEVVGIYDTDLTQADNLGLVAAAGAAAAAPALADQASVVYLRTEVGDEDAAIAALRADRPDLRYEPWQALQATVADLTGSFDVIGGILGAVSLFVAAITVFIVTYVDLVNKRRTIGIERAVGVTGTAIVGAYLVRAVTLAVVGVGVGAAFTFGLVVPLVDRHPFQFPIGAVTLTATADVLRSNGRLLVAVAIVGALVPAMRSVRLRLLDAIWG